MQVLSGSQGNLLEDEATIGIITEVKQLGNEIAEKQVLVHCLSVHAVMPDDHIVHMLLQHGANEPPPLQLAPAENMP